MYAFMYGMYVSYHLHIKIIYHTNTHKHTILTHQNTHANTSLTQHSRHKNQILYTQISNTLHTYIYMPLFTTNRCTHPAYSAHAFMTNAYAHTPPTIYTLFHTSQAYINIWLDTTYHIPYAHTQTHSYTDTCTKGFTCPDSHTSHTQTHTHIIQISLFQLGSQNSFAHWLSQKYNTNNVALCAFYLQSRIAKYSPWSH